MVIGFNACAEFKPLYITETSPFVLIAMATFEEEKESNLSENINQVTNHSITSTLITSIDDTFGSHPHPQREYRLRPMIGPLTYQYFHLG